MRDLFDLLLPSRCAGCGDIGERLLYCSACQRAAAALAIPDLGWVQWGEGITGAACYRYEGPVRAALLAMKAGGLWAAARPLAALMARRLPPEAATADVTWTWVPASRRRERRRGGDAAKVLAGHLARQAGGQAARRLLERVAERPDQTGLGVAARLRNPVGSFKAAGPVAPNVVLIDDVRTTGATAREAAKVLREAGTARVLVLTLARAGSSEGAPG